MASPISISSSRILIISLSRAKESYSKFGNVFFVILIGISIISLEVLVFELFSLLDGMIFLEGVPLFLNRLLFIKELFSNKLELIIFTSFTCSFTIMLLFTKLFFLLKEFHNSYGEILFI